MTTMLEKAAYAAFVNANKAKPERSAREIAAFWTAMGAARKAEWIDVARAALVAIREADGVAADAGAAAARLDLGIEWPFTGHRELESVAQAAFTAMIDAILAEKPEASPT